MAKGKGMFWVASANKAARQIYGAIKKKKLHVYVSKRWKLVAWILRIMPGYLYNRL
jgi:short-subunit dehydrogenase